MRTINVKAGSTKVEILYQVAATLENDILDDENPNGCFNCEIDYEAETITQYEEDAEGEIFNDVVWGVSDIDETGLSSTVNIDC